MSQNEFKKAFFTKFLLLFFFERECPASITISNLYAS